MIGREDGGQRETEPKARNETHSLVPRGAGWDKDEEMYTLPK